MNITENKKVIDPNQYPAYVVTTRHNGTSRHESVINYKKTDDGCLCIYGLYCIGVGSKDEIHGSQVEVREKVYAPGQWLSIEYVGGNQS